MLEAYLFTYQNQFGVPFPLAQYEGHTEAEVIGIVYACLQSNTPAKSE